MLASISSCSIRIHSSFHALSLENMMSTREREPFWPDDAHGSLGFLCETALDFFFFFFFFTMFPDDVELVA